MDVDAGPCTVRSTWDGDVDTSARLGDSPQRGGRAMRQESARTAGEDGGAPASEAAERADGVDADMGSREPSTRSAMPDCPRAETELAELGHRQHAMLLARPLGQRSIRAIASTLGSSRPNIGR